MIIECISTTECGFIIGNRYKVNSLGEKMYFKYQIKSELGINMNLFERGGLIINGQNEMYYSTTTSNFKLITKEKIRSEKLSTILNGR